VNILEKVVAIGLEPVIKKVNMDVGVFLGVDFNNMIEFNWFNEN